MFVLTAFQKSVNSASVDYHELGTLSWLLGLTHVALAHMWDFIWKIMMMSSSAISLWLGVYSNERHQELLLTGKAPGFIRILSTGLKTVCELLLPVIGKVSAKNTVLTYGPLPPGHFLNRSIKLNLKSPYLLSHLRSCLPKWLF